MVRMKELPDRSKCIFFSKFRMNIFPRKIKCIKFASVVSSKKKSESPSTANFQISFSVSQILRMVFHEAIHIVHTLLQLIHLFFSREEDQHESSFWFTRSICHRTRIQEALGRGISFSFWLAANSFCFLTAASLEEDLHLPFWAAFISFDSYLPSRSRSFQNLSTLYQLLPPPQCAQIDTVDREAQLKTKMVNCEVKKIDDDRGTVAIFLIRFCFLHYLNEILSQRCCLAPSSKGPKLN